MDAGPKLGPEPEVGAEEDEAILQRSVTGHAQVFERLVERYLHRIYRFLARMVGESWAEDLAQEVFLRAYERRSTYRSGAGSFSCWLYGIARNLAVDFLRRRRPVVSMEQARDVQDRALQIEDESAVGPPASLEAAEAGRVLEQAIQELPEPYRTTFLLCVLEGMSYEEAAAIEGCPVKTISSRLARGRARLRQQVARYLENEETHDAP